MAKRKLVVKIRKITRTTAGSILVNLYGFIPKEWEYCEIQQLKSQHGDIRLSLTEIKVGQPDDKVSARIPTEA